MTYRTPNSKTRHGKKATRIHASALGHAPKMAMGKSSVSTLRATEAPAWAHVWYRHGLAGTRVHKAGHDVARETVYGRGHYDHRLWLCLNCSGVDKMNGTYASVRSARVNRERS
jgi:hypothetical protein